MMPKERGLLERHADRGHGHVGLARAVEVDHLAHVHAVDVVGGEHRHHVGRVRLQDVEVLVHRVGGALEKPPSVFERGSSTLITLLGVVQPRRPRGGDMRA